MIRRIVPFAVFLALVSAALWYALRPEGTGPVVSLYTSVDDEFARVLAARFERETGIRVDLKTDTEASKTVGLANAVEDEARPGRTPRCDVYWGNEPLWTIRLAEKGVLEPYDSPAAAGIPEEWRDPDRMWTANGLRARVFIVHAPSVGGKDPSSYRDLADPAWKDRGSIARPAAGTTLSHMAALRAALGPESFRTWFLSLDGNGVTFASGNGPVAREVGRGARAFGFTDTDDCNARKMAGEPVRAVYPDQEEGGIGTCVLPVTVALVRNAPHPENARLLYDWLVSPEIEAALSASPYAAIPVRPGTKPGPEAPDLASFRRAKADWKAAATHVDAVLDLVREVLR